MRGCHAPHAGKGELPVDLLDQSLQPGRIAGLGARNEDILRVGGAEEPPAVGRADADAVGGVDLGAVGGQGLVVIARS